MTRAQWRERQWMNGADSMARPPDDSFRVGRTAQRAVVVLATFLLLISACTAIGTDERTTAARLDRATPAQAPNDRTSTALQAPTADDDHQSIEETAVQLDVVWPIDPEPIDYLDLDNNGEISLVEGRISRNEISLVTGQPAIAGTVALTPARRSGQPVARTNRLLSQPEGSTAIDTQRSTPDGLSTWIPFHDFLNRSTCDSVEGSVLGIASFDSTSPPVPAQPASKLPANISEIHHGPDDIVLLYSSCGDTTRPAAFARVLADGNFTSVAPIEAAFADTVAAGQPSWIWGRALGDPDASTDGELIAVIPQLGLLDDESPDDTWANAYVDVTSGEVLDVWPTGDRWNLDLANHAASSSGGAVDFGHGISFNGPTEFIGRPPIGAPDQNRVFIGGPTGLWIVSPSYNGTLVNNVTRSHVLDATWAPFGDAIVMATAVGPMLYNHSTWTLINDNSSDGTLSRLSAGQPHATATKAYFTPDGSRLILAGPDGFQVLDYTRYGDPLVPDTIAAWGLDSGGLGPIRIGMTAEEVRSELGFNVTLPDLDFTLGDPDRVPPVNCLTIEIAEAPGAKIQAVIARGGDLVIQAISVTAGPWQTPSGIGLGMPEDQVFDLLDGQLDQMPAASDRRNLTFIPQDPDDKNSIRFVTNQHEVVAMHAGDQDWISRSHSCL